MEPELTTCPACKRRGCWDKEEAREGLRFIGWDYVCKCGYSIAVEGYDCPIHGEGEGLDCPRC